MSRLTRIALIASLGFLAGQFSITYYSDPSILENNALNMILIEYYNGCIGGSHMVCAGKNLADCDLHTIHENCNSSAMKQYTDIKEIWTNSVWTQKGKHYE